MLRYEPGPDRVTLVIDDPERRNPLSNEAMRGLADGITRASADPAVRAVVVTGAGDRAFCAGGDLSGGFVDSPLATHGDRGALADLFRAMRRCGTPLIARVNGAALGGGLGLAVACDIVIAVDSARFGMPEIKIGLWPMMISAVLQRAMPQKAALELMMTGRRIDAAEALRLGIVSRVVAPAELDATIDETVEALASVSRAVLRAGKTAFYAAEDLGFDAALDHLHNGLTATAMTEDAAEGISAFLQKREPQWRGR